MRIPHSVTSILAVGAVTLSAIGCTGNPLPSSLQPGSSATEPAPTAATRAAPAAAAAQVPTPTFERVRDTEPTVAAPPKPTLVPPTPTAVVIKAHGLLVWHDDTGRSDGVLLSVDDLPSVSGDSAYGAWLTGADGNLFLGTLDAPTPVSGGNTRSLIFAAPDHTNLPADFDGVIVARSAKVSIETAAPTDAVVSGKLPPRALEYMRQVLVSSDDTPGQVGFAIGLRQESDKVLEHAQFLQDAVDESNIANVLFHAEHLVNMIEGKDGEHFGDLNGNGKIDNPGDGFGLLENGEQAGYVKGLQDAALQAAAAPDATEAIQLHASHVQIAGDNTRGRLIQIRDLALQVSKVRRAADARDNVQRIVALSHQLIDGVDLNGDELIAPVPGEGGVLTAYQHAQLMAGIELAPATTRAAAVAPTLAPTSVPLAVPTSAATVAPTAAVVVAPTAAPTAAPTVAAAAPTVAPTTTAAALVAPSRVELAISDDAFAPKTVTVAVGATVVWSRSGTHPHTVTADDNSYDSGTLRAGQTFEHTFTAPGTFPYYCDFHGGPGGVGMSGTVTVTP
jgi:plastocyanin